jgi:hypothetical protein
MGHKSAVMKRKLLFIAVFILVVISCRHRQTLTDQLTLVFSDHLSNIDSSATLDSVHILWNIPVTPRLTRIIDDSVYNREYTRIKAQLVSALQKQDRDSIEFYEYEIDVMQKEIDSISKGIEQEDTIRRYGHLIGCNFFIKKNGRSRKDATMVFVDSTSTLRFTEFMDSAIRRSIGRSD